MPVIELDGRAVADEQPGRAAAAMQVALRQAAFAP